MHWKVIKTFFNKTNINVKQSWRPHSYTVVLEIHSEFKLNVAPLVEDWLIFV